MKILLVDDHEAVRTAMRRTIERRTTFEVIGEASNGYEAIAKVEELDPDVVIMDIQMPGMDGIEATRNIVEAHPKILVLACSVLDDPKSIQAMRDAGASGYVIKGGDPNELVYSLKDMTFGELIDLRRQVEAVDRSHS